MAEGPAGRYGKVYVTYVLELDGGKNIGFMHGSGRGFPDEGPVMLGNFRGLWRRKSNKIDMRNVVDIDHGDQNLDIITVDMHKKSSYLSLYTGLRFAVKRHNRVGCIGK
ncbi:MAG: hypothetical protein HOI20_04025 [Gemmatimonadetes bacterium]|jgi:hypothetical protein|nr:hypothetical protein [Gemmatimonadota bacterium]MBT5800755.1 hypothetical protein [Gemmatimonadota bacterium]MBT6907985.1 hypothetical protein [Gemmatimonadota bacterium]MBT7420356.1 hypothetical protein [Gemmatimonadota bacterium]MBT7549310.1 hypothetical protein [Gemmatimonadota bacterium]